MIVNRGAGGGRDDAAVEQIAEAFNGAAARPAIVAVSGSDVAATAGEAVRAGSTLVVAAGGDGTVSTVASVLAGTPACLGVLPLGTLNHFARDLGIPTDLPGAVRALTSGQITCIDVGEVNGHSFVNNSSVGLYPRMVWERAREQRRGRRKWHAFVVAVLRVWRRFRRVTVMVGGSDGTRIVHTPFVFVGNNEYRLEGVRMGARHRLDAGCLHVCMAPGLGRFDVVRVLLAALVGRVQALDHFESARTAEFSIAAHRRRLGVSLDGELVVMRTPLRYRVRRRALRVVVPASELEDPRP